MDLPPFKNKANTKQKQTNSNKKHNKNTHKIHLMEMICSGFD